MFGHEISSHVDFMLQNPHDTPTPPCPVDCIMAEKNSFLNL
jgi:hypothetical protein